MDYQEVIGLLKEKSIFFESARESADFKSCDLRDETLKICKKIFKGVEFSRVEVETLIITDSVFIDCTFDDFNFKNAHIEKATFYGCHFKKFSFSKIQKFSFVNLQNSKIERTKESYSFFSNGLSLFLNFLEDKNFGTVEIDHYLDFRASMWAQDKHSRAFVNNFLNAMCLMSGTQAYGKDGSLSQKRNIMYRHHIDNWLKCSYESVFMSAFTALCSLYRKEDVYDRKLPEENLWLLELLMDDIDSFYEEMLVVAA